MPAHMGIQIYLIAWIPGRPLTFAGVARNDVLVCCEP